jgi:hypothetical protein
MADVPKDRMMLEEDPDHWVVRPGTIRWLWVGFAAVLALSLLAQAVVPIKSIARVDAWPGFAAAYGMLSCIVMIIVAKALGAWLKRKDDYYDA